MSLILEMLGWRRSFVESIVNENGSKPEYFSPVFLFFNSSLSVADSPTLRGDLEVTVITRLFCFIKCSAISLKSLNSRGIFLYIEFCTIVGVSTITTGVDGVEVVAELWLSVGTVVVGVTIVGIDGVGLVTVTTGVVTVVVAVVHGVTVVAVVHVRSTSDTIGIVLVVLL